MGLMELVAMDTVLAMMFMVRNTMLITDCDERCGMGGSAGDGSLTALI